MPSLPQFDSFLAWFIVGANTASGMNGTYYQITSFNLYAQSNGISIYISERATRLTRFVQKSFEQATYLVSNVPAKVHKVFLLGCA